MYKSNICAILCGFIHIAHLHGERMDVKEKGVSKQNAWMLLFLYLVRV